MAPKVANTGAKRKGGDLASWLKTSPLSNGQQKRPRSSSNSNTMDASKPSAEKKQKASPDEPDASESPNHDAPPRDSQTKNASESKKANTNANTNILKLTERTGDIFTAAPNTLIIHACNCQGSWGGGIALAFKKNYPEAFKVYAKHCRDHDAKSLLGTALLIPPVDGESETTGKGKVGAQRIGASQRGKARTKHFIACLFTSNFYGKRRDSPAKILAATGPAMEDLLHQVQAWNAAHKGGGGAGEKVADVRTCKINSGSFGVPWEETVSVLEGVEVGDADGEVKEVEIIERGT